FVELAQIELAFARTFRYAKPAAEIERAYMRESPRHLDQFACHGAPVLRVQDAAAAVRVNADNFRAGFIHQPDQLVQLEARDAELRMSPGRADVGVVTATVSGVEADKYLPVPEDFRPLAQWMEVVQGQQQIIPCRPLVFVA